MKDETKIVVSGRNPKDHAGAVNTPVYRASTIIYPSLAAIRGTEKIPYTYGRRGTPTTSALQDAMNVLEGCRRHHADPVRRISCVAGHYDGGFRKCAFADGG